MNRVKDLIGFLVIATLVLGVLFGIQYIYLINKPLAKPYIDCKQERTDLRNCEEFHLKSIHELQACQDELLKYRVKEALEIKR